jgi:hypothetical protein
MGIFSTTVTVLSACAVRPPRRAPPQSVAPPLHFFVHTPAGAARVRDPGAGGLKPGGGLDTWAVRAGDPPGMLSVCASPRRPPPFPAQAPTVDSDVALVGGGRGRSHAHRRGPRRGGCRIDKAGRFLHGPTHRSARQTRIPPLPPRVSLSRHAPSRRRWAPWASIAGWR